MTRTRAGTGLSLRQKNEQVADGKGAYTRFAMEAVAGK